MEDVPAKLILNSDQTGIELVPSSNWTIEKKGANELHCLELETNDRLRLLCDR